MSIKDQIKQKATAKLLTKYRLRYSQDLPFAWDVVRDAAQSGGQTARQEIAAALANTRAIGAQLRTLAEIEAGQLLADDSLTIEELDRIYGDG